MAFVPQNPSGCSTESSPTNRSSWAILEEQCSVGSFGSQGFLLFAQNVGSSRKSTLLPLKNLPRMWPKSWLVKQIWSYGLNCSFSLLEFKHHLHQDWSFGRCYRKCHDGGVWGLPLGYSVWGCKRKMCLASVESWPAGERNGFVKPILFCPSLVVLYGWRADIQALVNCKNLFLSPS